MAITKSELQVTWPTAANSKAVTADTREVSEIITLDATCFQAQIHLKATTGSTAPASDDIMHFVIVQTGGDPDGAGSDEYDTEPQTDGELGGARFLAALDCSVGETDTGSGKKMLATKDLPVANSSLKLVADGKASTGGTGTTNSITVSATITQHLAA